MDNLCHTLAGAVLAEAGLRRRTPLAVPTLVIGANLPDLDALAYLRDPLFALTLRRGWTHGVLAVVLLPVLLAAAMLVWDRLARRNHDRPHADPGSLLLVAAIAVLSHRCSISSTPTASGSSCRFPGAGSTPIPCSSSIRGSGCCSARGPRSRGAGGGGA
jgi:hypothetical protein